MQTFDVLNGLRFILTMLPEINRKRIFNYGGSQGGCIALLCSIFAPDTFAFTYASSAITYFEEGRQKWCGREFADHEISIRSAIEHTDMIKCPLFLEHGTADETVPHEHTQKLVEKLKSQNKQVMVKYYEGGGHGLEPVITKIEAFKAMATDPMNNLTCATEDDFMEGRTIEISCGEKILIIDWSQPTDSIKLFHWK
jgi:dipeptidyl aminopeptidase/acylaminoacyl peptidase